MAIRKHPVHLSSPRAVPKLPRALILTLILREVRRSKLATGLSIAAVGIAVAIMIGAEVTTQAMHNAISVRDAVQGRADISVWRFAIVPELSFFGSTYFSFLMHPAEMREGRDWAFTFNEGGWDSALIAMQQGCGLLVMPKVAAKLGASLGDEVRVTGARGPVRCTLAGIGSTYVAASVIGTAEPAAFGGAPSFSMLIDPLPGTDRVTLGAELAELDARTPRLSISTLEGMTERQTNIIEGMPQLINALLLLAMVAAAMSVVNTFAMAVAERRTELALLWAVGGARNLLRLLVAGEAVLIGLVGGAVGLAAGVGVTLIVPTVAGGSSWGMPDLDLWTEAFAALHSALVSGLIGLAIAPLLALSAAWLAARSFLRRVSVRELLPEGI